MEIDPNSKSPGRGLGILIVNGLNYVGRVLIVLAALIPVIVILSLAVCHGKG